MGNTSNEKKYATLGMPYGTASHKLRKMLLFHQLQKHSENVCVRCKKLIEKVAELSIEHIEPWEGINAELFWNLDNIAFSHLACNRPHRVAIERTKFAPEGLVWCPGHKAYRKIEEFHSNIRNVNGVASYCRECRKVRSD